MRRYGRSMVPLVGAGALALVALAAFLILDLGSRSVNASSIPVIQLGQTDAGQSGEATESTSQSHLGTDQGQGPTDSSESTLSSETPEAATPQTTVPASTASSSTTPTTGSGTTTTGSTLRETINGGVRTGTTGGSGGTSTDPGRGGGSSSTTGTSIGTIGDR